MSEPAPQSALSPVEEIIEEARNGRMFILVDAEDRENEGDLI
ncbi:MAG TPA: 3,4-dihydroxy-2-butanone-4-phosphate synthase, partial [Oceanicaulis sp.]|nr:3,4-dihydroxy-2-butanone-4-phosphate synthase [Oceanicaulis sp.]